MGYFATGALASALAAGIGAGVGAALAGNAAAGGGFAAGFMGTATISSSGFVAGSLSGAAAGITNGLITGTGNGLVEGKNIGEALLSKNGGLDQAWKQGLGGAAFGGLMGTLDAISNNEDWLTGSTAKRYAFTDGENTMTPDATYDQNLTSIQKKSSIELKRTNNPYQIEIKAPKSWEVTGGEFTYTTGNNIYAIQHITENNSLIVKFPIGTPNGGYYAAHIQQATRVINQHNLIKLQLFFKNKRDFSTLFWYLKFIIK